MRGFSIFIQQAKNLAMRTILTSLFLILFSSVFAQQKTDNPPAKAVVILTTKQTIPNDSIKVSFAKNKSADPKDKQPSYFIDSVLVSLNTLTGINPEEIMDVKVEKNAADPRFRNPNGTIFITTKSLKKIDLIPLSQINRDYVHSDPVSTLYMFENTILTDDIESYKIDKNYILGIEVLTSDDINYLKASKTKFTIIKILGKSKENLQKANQIMIRGNAETVSLK
ncbi:hypothetical protein B0O44_104413 [Pedobacter nutrimenti]|uniref:Uncharacterized protein n=2 Tax=Pedobacter nutrimenti TaxID=1241337 RepID=A0A318UCS1_9SPHI|nr:hypothetical protein B0O44_104413 [Pedobacter nutrimenti]